MAIAKGSAILAVETIVLTSAGRGIVLLLALVFQENDLLVGSLVLWMIPFLNALSIWTPNSCKEANVDNDATIILCSMSGSRFWTTSRTCSLLAGLFVIRVALVLHRATKSMNDSLGFWVVASS